MATTIGLSPEHIAAILAQAGPAITAQNPNAHLTTNDFDDHTARTLYVKLKGSLDQFQRGTVETTWRVDEGQEHVYMRIASLHPETRQPIYEGDLAKGIIMDMRLKNIRSTFPVAIGANSPGVVGTRITRSGKTFMFIAKVLPSSFSHFSASLTWGECF